MKITKLFAVVMISTTLAACGPKAAAGPETEVLTTREATTVATTAGKSGEEEIPAVEVEDHAQTIETEESKESKTEDIAETQAEQKAEGIYEDNFAVETSAAAAFAEKVKAAVTARDIEALADLTAFPVYVGIAEDGVETREEFIALGADKLFTPGLIYSVEGADTSDLSPSMAGFSISKDGKSNIIFGVVEGKLAISGINYE